MANHTLNSLSYHVAEHGSGPEAVLLLHGFTGSSAGWAHIGTHLARHFRVLAPDLIGHGQTDSPRDPERYRIERATADLIALLDSLGLTAVHWAGYSMGARLALHAALHHPERVSTLTLESGSPGLATEAERSARVAADTVLADRIERDGLESFVTYWESLPLFASQARLPESVRAGLHAARLRNNPTGLANSLRGMGTGAQPSGWESLSGFGRPTRLVVGALDSKFVRIATQMLARLPNATCVVVPDVGHAVHVERPAAVYRVLRGKRLEPPPAPSSEAAH